MMFFLLFFIIIVAAFGIVNCQITFVVQKTREIGILKALGASNRQVLWIFHEPKCDRGLSRSRTWVRDGTVRVALSERISLGHESHVRFRIVARRDLQVYELPASIQSQRRVDYLWDGISDLRFRRTFPRVESIATATRGGVAL